MTRKNTPVKNQAKPKRKQRASVNEETRETREVTRDSRESREPPTRESREAATRESPMNHQQEDKLTDQQRAAVTKFVRTTLTNGIDKLKTEYEQLKEFKPPDNAKTAFSANLKKCRYKDVVCWDRTRVKLTFGGDEGDFIHANHVTNEVLLNRFICCQGPLEATVNDFWRMVWQEHVPLIIMLCQVREQGKGKCAQYWPLKEGETKSYGKITVTCDTVCTKDPNITLTKLIVEFKKQKRMLEHRQWVTWPDKTVPKSSSVAFRLLHFPREYTNHPSIVHCSAGVGRTGTLVALEIVLRTLLGNDGEKIKIQDIVKELRCARSQAVQTEDQYVYIHFAMCQYAVMKKFLPRDEIEGFIKDYEEYLKTFESGTSAKGKKKAAAKPTCGPSAEVIEDKPSEEQPRHQQTSEEFKENKEMKEEDNRIVPQPPSPGGHAAMAPMSPPAVAVAAQVPEREREESLIVAKPTLHVAVAVATVVPDNKAVIPENPPPSPKPTPQAQIPSPPQQPPVTLQPVAVPSTPPPVPVVTQPAPVVAQSTPGPVVAQPSPAVPPPAPVAPKPIPVVAQPTPVVTQPTPMAPKPVPVVSQPQPIPVVPQPQPVPVVSQPQPVPVAPVQQNAAVITPGHGAPTPAVLPAQPAGNPLGMNQCQSTPAPPAQPQARPPAVSVYKPPVAPTPFRPGIAPAAQPVAKSGALIRSSPAQVQNNAQRPPMMQMQAPQPPSPGKPTIVYQKSNVAPIKVLAGVSSYKVIQQSNQQPPNGLPPGQNSPKPQ